jgi:predicted RNase H-like HicB family nuclease
VRNALIYRDESGGWVAEVPSLPGCISQGDTYEEALSNIQAAIELYTAALGDLGEPVPPDTSDARLVRV